MFPAKYLAIITAGALALLSMGCVVDVKPDRAVNPVGTEHTVTAVFREDTDFDEQELCQLFSDIFEVPYPCGDTQALPAVDEDYLHFEVISGPNTGAHSSGDCEPSCSYFDEDGEISWTYLSNGIPGTDVIEVCDENTAYSITYLYYLYDEYYQGSGELSEEEFYENFVDAINQTFDEDYEDIEDLICTQVTKTWMPRQERAPNIGAGLSGLFQGQPTALPTAAVPAPAAPSPVIRPPNTGDAGLK